MTAKLAILHLINHAELSYATDSVRFPHIRFLNFRYSYSAIAESPLHLMHSIGCTPARYIEILINQAIPLRIEEDIFVVNPLVKLSGRDYVWIAQLSSQLSKWNQVVTVVADNFDLPLGYYLKASSCERLKREPELLFRFRLLSCTSASLDSTYLSHFFDAGLFPGNFRSHVEPESGFFYEELTGIYRLTTCHALRALSLSKDEIDWVAVMPYHAGDVLFFVKAFLEVHHLFRALLVNHEYESIVRSLAPQLPLIVASDPTIARGPNSNRELTYHQNQEALYFHQVLYRHLPQRSFFYWFRQSRDYNLSKTHLVDQWKQSLTNDHFDRLEPSGPLDIPKKFYPKSVFLHFDGGWNLKIYPEEMQRELINLLQQRGYSITVLTDRKREYSCKVVPFTNLEQLTQDILEHSVLVGMDSFPAHFAAHRLQHPTICLFSSTRPENSNFTQSDRYRFLSKNLSCSPCLRPDWCKEYDSSFCHNFVGPDDIVSAIEKMHTSCYTQEHDDRVQLTL